MEEREIVKSSIFLQETYKRRYCASVIKREKYSFLGDGSVVIRNDVNKENILKEQHEIFRCEIPMPLLEEGDKFYIEEQAKLVTVVSICRTSKDAVVYILEPEFIDDELTLQSYKDAFKKLEDKLAEFELYEKIKDVLEDSTIYRIFLKHKVEKECKL